MIVRVEQIHEHSEYSMFPPMRLRIYNGKKGTKTQATKKIAASIAGPVLPKNSLICICCSLKKVHQAGLEPATIGLEI
jgi:hypothetical protein